MEWCFAEPEGLAFGSPGLGARYGWCIPWGTEAGVPWDGLEGMGSRGHDSHPGGESGVYPTRGARLMVDGAMDIRWTPGRDWRLGGTNKRRPRAASPALLVEGGEVLFVRPKGGAVDETALSEAQQARSEEADWYLVVGARIVLQEGRIRLRPRGENT